MIFTNRKIKINCMLCKQDFMLEDGTENEPPKVTGVGLFTADYIQNIGENGSIENSIDKLNVEPFIVCPTCEAIINDVIESRDPQFRNRQIQQSMRDYAEEYHRVKMEELPVSDFQRCSDEEMNILSKVPDDIPFFPGYESKYDGTRKEFIKKEDNSNSANDE